jgi:hypothetical protein
VAERARPAGETGRAHQSGSDEGDLEDLLDCLTTSEWAEAFAMFGVAVSEARTGEAEEAEEPRPPVVLAGLADWLRDKAVGGAKKRFLEWWLAYLEAMAAYEMLDGWITSPHHLTADDDDVRIEVRTRIGALTKKAKEKLVKRLKERAKALRQRARQLRADGKAEQADRTERQAGMFDAAADEVEKSLH